MRSSSTAASASGAPTRRPPPGCTASPSGTYPFLKNRAATAVRQGPAYAEIGIGALLLTPFVPTAVAGAALTGFSGGLLGLYLNTPGMRKPGSLAPTQDGLAIAKDVWLLGIGIGLLTRGLTERKAAELTKAHKKAHTMQHRIERKTKV